MRWLPELTERLTVARRRARVISSLLAPRWRRFADIAAGGLVEIHDVAPNPGGLRMLLRIPTPPPQPGAPLIVLLHGCGQPAHEFAITAGWTALADRLGLALLLPAQRARNNRRRCFSWFSPADIRRDGGEAGSIAAMVDEALRRLGGDPGRVFVAGHSAGGAMAAALLAAYPEKFAAGAVLAGLPVGVASNPTAAIARMTRAPAIDIPDLAERARALAPDGYAGPWPRLVVWHGAQDRIVDPANAQLLARQFTALHADDPNAVAVWLAPDQDHDAPADAAERIAAFWGLG